jgi:hypothetical protein
MLYITPNDKNDDTTPFTVLSVSHTVVEGKVGVLGGLGVNV